MRNSNSNASHGKNQAISIAAITIFGCLAFTGVALADISVSCTWRMQPEAVVQGKDANFGITLHYDTNFGFIPLPKNARARIDIPKSRFTNFEVVGVSGNRSNKIKKKKDTMAQKEKCYSLTTENFSWGGSDAYAELRGKKAIQGNGETYEGSGHTKYTGLVQHFQKILTVSKPAPAKKASNASKSKSKKSAAKKKKK